MIIGLAGYARTGKDAVGRMLVDRGFERVSFADILRRFILAVDPLVPNRVNHPSSESYIIRLSLLIERIGWDRAKDEVPEVRELLQRTGTDAGRNILGQDVWVQAAFNTLEEGKDYVFTDVRFPNEGYAILEHGGEVWRLERPGYGPVNDHPSETAMDGWPYNVTLKNEGTVEDLLAKVAEVLDMPRGG